MLMMNGFVPKDVQIHDRSREMGFPYGGMAISKLLTLTPITHYIYQKALNL